MCQLLRVTGAKVQLRNAIDARNSHSIGRLRNSGLRPLQIAVGRHLRGTADATTENPARDAVLCGKELPINAPYVR